MRINPDISNNISLHKSKSSHIALIAPVLCRQGNVYKYRDVILENVMLN